MPKRHQQFKSKKPGTHVTVKSIKKDFGATEFLAHLTSFLREQSIVARVPFSERSVFPIYHRLYLSLPPVPEVSGDAPVRDVIIATKANRGKITTNGIKNASASRFSTALLRVPTAGSSLSDSLSGLGIAQIRLIFKLPESSGLSIDEPLAYVHWFKPLGWFDDTLGMFQTLFSSRNHRQ
ncbi:hypothetical protein DXG03_009634, partial [Asterophora parasitica]